MLDDEEERLKPVNTETFNIMGFRLNIFVQRLNILSGTVSESGEPYRYGQSVEFKDQFGKLCASYQDYKCLKWKKLM